MARVLAVDDDAGVRVALRRTLGKLGHVVWDASDGSEALRLLGSVPFDMVIADVYMAEMDGMELLVRIQQRGLRIPVVMISGGGYVPRDEVLVMAKGCGAVATVDKPFTPDQLRAVIEPLLGRPGASVD